MPVVFQGLHQLGFLSKLVFQSLTIHDPHNFSLNDVRKGNIGMDIEVEDVPDLERLKAFLWGQKPYYTWDTTGNTLYYPGKLTEPKVPVYRQYATLEDRHAF